MSLAQVLVNLLLAVLAYAGTHYLLRKELDSNAAVIIAVFLAIVVFVLNIAATLGVA